MAFSNFGSGGGSSASDVAYALRLMVRDERERLFNSRQIGLEIKEQERERSRQTAGEIYDPVSKSEKTRGANPEPGLHEASEHNSPALDDLEESQEKNGLGYWLSEDSPLFLHNVPSHVVDPDRAVREVAVHHLGEDKARELIPNHFGSLDKSARGREAGRSVVTAQDLFTNLVTFARLMDEKIERMPRLGTPLGDRRTHYQWLTSPGQDLSNRRYKHLNRDVINRVEPRMIVVGGVHRDTANLHAHKWVSALLAGEKGKLHLGKVANPDNPRGKWVNVDLNEVYIKVVSEQLNDPNIYQDYVTKKGMTRGIMARVREALKNGERPPALPYRAQYSYDNLGEARERATRRRVIARGEDPGPPRKAPPVPRNASTFESAKLWGKAMYGEQHAECRRALLEGFVAMRGQVRLLFACERLSLTDVAKERAKINDRYLESPTGHNALSARDRRRIDYLDKVEALLHRYLVEETTRLQKGLAGAEQFYREHRPAYEKTIANRRRDGRSELKYPIHDTRQLEEMRNLAEQTRSAKWVAYVHQYEMLDRPSDPDQLGRVIAARLRDHIMAAAEVELQARNLNVIERDGRKLLLIERDEGGRDRVTPAGDRLRREHHIIAGWLGGCWTLDEVRDSLALMRDETVKSYAERYLNACEYLRETEKILGEYRASAEDVRVAPALRADQSADDLADLKSLLAKEDALIGASTREMFQTVLRISGKGAQPTPEEFGSMIAPRLFPYRPHGVSRDKQFRAFRPHDDEWVVRLIAAKELSDARLCVLAMHRTRRREWHAALETSKSLSEAVELANEIRAQYGKNIISTIVLTRDEARDLYRLKRDFQKRLAGSPQWKEEQVERLQAAMTFLSPTEREKLSPVIEKERQRLAQAKREEELQQNLETVRVSFSEAASQYLAPIIQAGDLKRMPDTPQIAAHTAQLTEMYKVIIAESGFTQEQLGLSDEQIARHGQEECPAALTLPDPRGHGSGESGRHDTLSRGGLPEVQGTEHLEAQLMLARGRELVAFAEYYAGRASADVVKHYDRARGNELDHQTDLLEKAHWAARLETYQLWQEYSARHGDDVQRPPAALTWEQRNHLTGLLYSIGNREQEARNQISYELRRSIDLPFQDPSGRLGQVEEIAHAQIQERQAEMALRQERGYGAAVFEFADWADIDSRDR